MDVYEVIAYINKYFYDTDEWAILVCKYDKNIILIFELGYLIVANKLNNYSKSHNIYDLKLVELNNTINIQIRVNKINKLRNEYH